MPVIHEPRAVRALLLRTVVKLDSKPRPVDTSRTWAEILTPARPPQ